MIPSGQDFTSWTETLKTFNEVTIPALFGFIIFVFLLLGFYFLRGVFGRDKRSTATTDKILELMAGMQAGAKDRQLQIDRFSVQMEKSDDLSRAALAGVQAALTALAQSNENATTNIRALIGRTDHSVTLLQNVTSGVNQTTLDIAKVLEGQRELKASVERVYNKLATLFPREDETAKDMIEDIVVRGVQDVFQEKRITGEHPITDPPKLPEATPQ